ncbi:hypothetical protein N7G274_007826 [Stereocaulon virgatum]|uniref:U3 small nucleolar RNA-associated protein 6 N-terminal domain-containing protein n=1 Tax=Stereocaulon virgatum TaxID=373712 RepID=A0ABR4A0S1_9LECA
MAGASDKVRFYLEQSVPELQELAAKEIFTTQEILSITKKRSDFEHKLNARGSQAADYARYAEYEMNLESLRKKRAKRLGVKSTNHTGQRRIFFVLERATRKFQGDLGLWIQYIAYARKQRSNKKVSQILTSVLRLHPTRPELWIYAANYALEEKGDMTEARSYLQRGLRFCGRSERMWLQYARLEMGYVAKIVGRRRILGLDQEQVQQDNAGNANAIDDNVVALPIITAEDINPEQKSSEGVDQKVLDKLDASPALSGAIPIAIFDAAIKQFKEDQKLCLHFFDMIANFVDLPCTRKILVHIMETLQTLAPESPETLIRWIQQPVIGLNVDSIGFPTNLGLCLDRIKASLQRHESSLTAWKTAQSRLILEQQIIEWMLPYLEEDELDEDVRKVIVVTLRKVWSQLQSDVEQDPNGKGSEVASLISKLQAHELHRVTEPARAWALQMWPNEAAVFSQAAEV